MTARDLNGNVLFDEKAGHVFQIEDGLIRRFDIRKERFSMQSSGCAPESRVRPAAMSSPPASLDRLGRRSQRR